MNSATWIAIVLKVLGWLKEPTTYWKAKDYIEKKEREDYERNQKIIDDINNRKH